MTLIGGEDRETVRGSGCGDRDILEAGIVRARLVEDRAGVAGVLDSKRQNPSGVEVLDSIKPLAKAFRLGRCADTNGAGDPRLDLGDGRQQAAIAGGL